MTRLGESSTDLVARYQYRIPHAKSFADYVWPGMLISPERIAAAKDFEFGEKDVVIISYPKSGTTWASEVVSAIAHNTDIDALKKKRLDERVPWIELEADSWWIKVFFSWKQRLLEGKKEEEASTALFNLYFTHLPLELLPKSILEGRCRVIYVARNPKDTAVSFFHFHRMARFLGLQKTSWNEFLQLFCSGDLYSGSWFDHVSSYYKFAQLNPDTVHFVKYEDMKEDLTAEVQKLEKFVGVKLTEEGRKRVVDHCTFSTMKENKMANRDGVMLFDENISKFMRKGTIGDWRNYFTLNQNAEFNALYEEKLRDTGLSFRFE